MPIALGDLSDGAVAAGTVALAVATLGLVAATAFLARYTRRLVTEAAASRNEAKRTRLEMEEARALSIRPRIALDVMVLGGKVGYLLIRNVGNGPALRVGLELRFSGAVDEERVWREPSFVPGESHELRLPEPFHHDISGVATRQLTVSVKGTYQNLGGRKLPLEETLDVTAWWNASVANGERVAGRRKLPGVDPATYGLVERG